MRNEKHVTIILENTYSPETNYISIFNEEVRRLIDEEDIVDMKLFQSELDENELAYGALSLLWGETVEDPDFF